MPRGSPTLLEAHVPSTRVARVTVLHSNNNTRYNTTKPARELQRCSDPPVPPPPGRQAAARAKGTEAQRASRPKEVRRWRGRARNEEATRTPPSAHAPLLCARSPTARVPIRRVATGRTRSPLERRARCFCASHPSEAARRCDGDAEHAMAPRPRPPRRTGNQGTRTARGAAGCSGVQRGAAGHPAGPPRGTPWGSGGRSFDL